MATPARGFVSRLLNEGEPESTTRSKGRKLRVEEDLRIPDHKVALIADFIGYCCRSLPIKGGFEIHLVADRHSNQIETTAYCDPRMGVMKIYCRGRAVPDVLRSIGHEMAHLRQGEVGEIGPHPVMYAGGYLEDDANSRAGTLLKLFAKKYGMDRVYDE
jgi:hypothetical protein